MYQVHTFYGEWREGVLTDWGPRWRCTTARHNTHTWATTIPCWRLSNQWNLFVTGHISDVLEDKDRERCQAVWWSEFLDMRMECVLGPEYYGRYGHFMHLQTRPSQLRGLKKGTQLSKWAVRVSPALCTTAHVRLCGNAVRESTLACCFCKLVSLLL